MPAPMPQETTRSQAAHAVREALLTNFMTYPPPDGSSSPDVPIVMIPPSVMNDDNTQSSSRNADEKKAHYDRRIRKPETWEYYRTIMSQFSNLVLIATFAGGVQAAVLSLINDLLSSLELKLFPGDWYSAYSLGILLGILAVTLNLAVAVIAAVNAALASHLSLHPPQKAHNIEGRLIFCMVVLFGTAIVSGSSLILLASNIDYFFTTCIGFLLLSGIGISMHHVLALFGFQWLKRLYKTPLPAASLILSTVAFILALSHPNGTMWITAPNYYFTLTYHLLAVIQNTPQPGRRSITCAFILCLSWTACSIVACVFSVLSTRALWYVVALTVVSSLEATTLSSIGIVGIWKRRRRPQMNSAEA